MDCRIRLDMSKLVPALKDQVRAMVLGQVEGVVKAEIDSYLNDLEMHMGSIPGETGYSEGNLKWSPLDPESLEKEGTFWYETGRIKNALVVNFDSSNNSVSARIGITDKEAYNEFLWNELGYTATNGKLIRRPLFIPLAETHMAELRKRLDKALGNLRMTLKVNIA